MMSASMSKCTSSDIGQFDITDLDTRRKAARIETHDRGIRGKEKRDREKETE